MPRDNSWGGREGVGAWEAERPKGRTSFSPLATPALAFAALGFGGARGSCSARTGATAQGVRAEGVCVAGLGDSLQSLNTFTCPSAPSPLWAAQGGPARTTATVTVGFIAIALAAASWQTEGVA